MAMSTLKSVEIFHRSRRRLKVPKDTCSAKHFAETVITAFRNPQMYNVKK
jgi:hypothetical protein